MLMRSQNFNDRRNFKLSKISPIWNFVKSIDENNVIF